MAKPILVANWKNHPKSLREAGIILKGLGRSAPLYKRLATFIAVPFPYLDLVLTKARRFASVASQNMAPVLQGTHTGVVTPDILKSFGTKLTILGHSELRALGETDAAVSEKVRMAIRSGILPLVCVGERAVEEDGSHFEFVRQQLKASLAGLRKADANRLMIAYEPIWAIGKHASDALKPENLSESIIFIRKVLVEIFGRTLAEKVPILYGGSVEPAGVEALWKVGKVQGFLVGHASLRPNDFKAIAQALLSK